MVYNFPVVTQVKDDDQPKSSEWKWDKINMDSLTKLPATSWGNDMIWVIVDWWTKNAHIFVNQGERVVRKLDKMYMEEIVTWHGLPLFIISNHHSRFDLRLWRELQEELGMGVHLSTVYHP